MKDPLISVIVPIYMIDRYIGICIESILNQTYHNLEILLVDDGSSDRCPETCDLYQKKDPRIKVIHKPNGGLVSARKAGLQESNGDYIACVDGDDWIDPCFIENLYTAARSTDADMVCAGFTRELFSKSAQFFNQIPSGVYEGERLDWLLRNMISCGPYYSPGITTYVWNKLYKRKVLLEQQVSVDNRISIGEDGAVVYPTLLKCRRVTVIENAAYHYRQREDSMLKRRSGYLEEAIKLRYLYAYLKRWASAAPEPYALREQVNDYVLSLAIIRSGGWLPQGGFSAFDSVCCNQNVVIYSAGTFGQQLAGRLKEYGLCHVVGWLDDDYWEYRRCCLDVDPVESIPSLFFDYVLIATVDSRLSDQIKKRLTDLGVDRDRLLAVAVPSEKESLLERFLDTEAIRAAEHRKCEVFSHA